MLDPESPDAATDIPCCLMPCRCYLLLLLLQLPLTFSVRKRGHRCRRGCFLGYSLMEQLLLVLLLLLVLRVAAVACFVTGRPLIHFGVVTANSEEGVTSKQIA